MAMFPSPAKPSPEVCVICGQGEGKDAEFQRVKNGLGTIIAASKQRGDTLHQVLKEPTCVVHRKCRAAYTHPKNIEVRAQTNNQRVWVQFLRVVLFIFGPLPDFLLTLRFLTQGGTEAAQGRHDACTPFFGRIPFPDSLPDLWKTCPHSGAAIQAP